MNTFNEITVRIDIYFDMKTKGKALSCKRKLRRVDLKPFDGMKTIHIQE